MSSTPKKGRWPLRLALAAAVVAALVPVLGAYRLDVTELLNAR